MARRAPYATFDKRGIAYIDTRVAGSRIKKSLGVPSDDVKQVREAAALLYARLVAGRSVPTPESRVATSATLGELVELFVDEAKTLYPRSWPTLESHLVRLLDPPAPTLAEFVTDRGPYEHGLRRLRRVTRGTMLRELTSVRAFLRWCQSQGHLRDVPVVPKFPTGLSGVRSGKQRTKVVEVTHEEALAVIDAIPLIVHAKRFGVSFVARARVRFMYEMAMRPSMVSRLEVPLHWRPGADVLTITADIDKVGNARVLPLTAMARAILERHAPARGVIFPPHDMRKTIKKAAATVLDPARAKDFARYDFRHGRATSAMEASGNNILGVGYLLGHTRPSTTDRYSHAARKHVATLMETLDK